MSVLGEGWPGKRRGPRVPRVLRMAPQPCVWDALSKGTAMKVAWGARPRDHGLEGGEQNGDII